MFDFYTVFYYFLIYAFLGWVSEVCYAYYHHRRFVNRGFLRGPLCPIYGVGSVLVFLFVEYMSINNMRNSELNNIEIFFYVMVITTLIEFITGYALEKIFHTKWWDYSNVKFNIKGYVCLSFSIVWGLVGVVALKTIHLSIATKVSQFPKEYGQPLLYVLFIVFAADAIVTIKELTDFRKIVLEMERISDQIKEELDEKREAIKEELDEKRDAIREELDEKREAIREELDEKRDAIKEELDEKKASIKEDLNDKKVYIIDEIAERKEVIKGKTDVFKGELYETRLYKAFPDIKSEKYQDKFDEIKRISLKRKKEKKKMEKK